MFKSIILATMLTISVAMPTYATTLAEFNTQLAETSRNMRAEMDHLADMLGQLSQEDIKKLESTAIETDSILCQADILIMSSDSVYAGLDQFNYYT